MEDESMTAVAKGYKGIGMEGSVARWYDRTTRKDMGEFVALAARIATAAPAGAEVLEVAPGPGFLSIEMARRGMRVTAVDISKTFLELGARNAAQEGAEVRFLHGDAAVLPVPDASVDFVVCRAAFKNFTRPVEAMSEMRRVLRPGGTAVLIDMRREASMKDLRPYVERMSSSWLDRASMTLTFRMLIRRAYPIAQIRRMMHQAGWKNVELNLTASGFEAWMRRE
jgi:ubiquinone/menaquinone biosynthesis C-methylase UbiE